MSLLHINKEVALSGELTLVSAGRSVAEFYLATPVGKSQIMTGTSCTLSWADGTQDLMTCKRAGADKGKWRVLLVGGAGGLSTSLRAKYYSGILPNHVASDMLGEMGEKAGVVNLSGGASNYVRLAGVAYEQLEAFLELYPGTAWRVGRSGTVGVRPLPWTVDNRRYVVIEQQPAENLLTLKFDAGIDAGTTLQGVGQLDRVIHRIGPERRQTEVYHLG